VDKYGNQAQVIAGPVTISPGRQGTTPMYVIDRVLLPNITSLPSYMQPTGKTSNPANTSANTSTSTSTSTTAVNATRNDNLQTVSCTAAVGPEYTAASHA
jgi:hypothetical protein